MGSSEDMDKEHLIHKDIMKDDRYIKLPLAKQLGNIGAEIARLVHWKKKNDRKLMEGSWDRALELIDLTVYGLQKNEEFPKIKEVLRLRELLCDYAGDFGFYEVSGEELVDYCTSFLFLS